MYVLFSFWFVLLFEPQWLLAPRGLPVLLLLPLGLLFALVCLLCLGALNKAGSSRRWTWYVPLLSYIGASAITVPFALNRGVAYEEVRTIFFQWIMVAGTVALTDRARRAEMLLYLYGLQFLWYGLWGFTGPGYVPWQTVLSNYDGYGSWMVIGGGFCSFLVLASDDKWLRRLMLITVPLCVVGMVASFARGAFLSALLMLVLVWIRSPNKGKMFAGVVFGGLLLVVAANLLFGEAYWTEMSTILEGTEEATGDERMENWKAAFRVFLAHPVLGAGAGNWSIFGATIFRPGEYSTVWGPNPALMLWGTQTHNTYVQILAEHGIVGSVLFVWILIDFWRRNVVLRTPWAAERWRAIGGRLKLSAVALGIEAAMVGWMTASMLYSMAGTHWFYTIAALNLTLHALLTHGTRTRKRQLRISAVGAHVPKTNAPPFVGTQGASEFGPGP
ncbi:MAG: O-antigen ligase family protein [Dehalococcoidia bacterium]